MNQEKKQIETVGDRVKKIRKWLNLTQKEFAVKLGYNGDNPDRAIHYIENGTRPLPPKKLQLINDLFEVDGLNPDYLLFKSDYMTYEDLSAAWLSEDSAKSREVSEALETLIKEAAFRSGFNTEYVMVDDYRYNYQFRNYKSLDFCPAKGLVWSFSCDDELINDYMQDLLGYAEYQFMRMIRKRLPNIEGSGSNGKAES